ncbi:MAG: hypothetical protein AVDCRST_MAG88-620 [uncultured Thermomicrobiales bacterium]|uniref:Uncharacterized protein n=1 Tax=uncultured Thermomicrobiales bacterium TaxID=1645740 RepID=A0A6J4UIQ5_9BACT|nr:MAG: hypothetical protein AVDCRST_MAG88-620 [uncultured Thermomicrobiales bacterium]
MRSRGARKASLSRTFPTGTGRCAAFGLAEVSTTTAPAGAARVTLAGDGADGAGALSCAAASGTIATSCALPLEPAEVERVGSGCCWSGMSGLSFGSGTTTRA